MARGNTGDPAPGPVATSALRRTGALYRGLAPERRGRDPGLRLGLPGLPQLVRPTLAAGLAVEAAECLRRQRAGALYRGLAPEHRGRDRGLGLALARLPHSLLVTLVA